MLKSNINNYIFILLLILSLFFQLTLLPQLFFNMIQPDLVLILLIAASFLFKSPNIFYAVFFCGFILNIFAGTYFGPMLISFLLTIFISSYFSHYFLKEIFSARLFLISFGAILFYNLIYFVLINITNIDKIINNIEFLIFAATFNMVYAAFLIIPLIHILRFGASCVKEMD